MNIAELNRMGAQMRKRIEAIRAKRQVVTASTAIPDDPIEAYDQHIIWRHISTGQPVRGITDAQRWYLEHSSCWRWHTDHNGVWSRQRGSDCIIKSRKMYFTSLMIGLSVIEMCRVAGTRVVIVLQTGDPKVVYPIWDQTLTMIGDLPAGWCEVETSTRSGAFAIRLAGGSSIEFVTSGSDARTADRQIRSGTAHIVILSEAGMYAEYATILAAAKGALPPGGGGYLVAESTQPRLEDHAYNGEVRRTLDGNGSYLWGATFPWYDDPQCVMRPTDPEWSLVMCDDFVSGMDQRDRDAELRLNLTPEQIAWRRWTYCRGEMDARAQMRREYLETLGDCYTYQTGDTWLPEDALAQLDAQVRHPIAETRLGDDWVGRVYSRDVSFVLVTTDSATYRGSDNSAVCAVDPYTGDLVAEVYGDATVEMHMDGIHWVLEQLGCEPHDRHVIAPEINYDERIGLVKALVEDRSLRLFYPIVYSRRTGKLSVSDRPGYLITRGNRDRFISLVELVIAGDPQEPDVRIPTASLPSAVLAGEARKLVRDKTGKVAAPEGTTAHDDLIMSYAGARYVLEMPDMRRLLPGRGVRRSHSRREHGGRRRAGLKPR